MLKVKTTLKVSPINGIGLFADQTITPGTIIWEYDPKHDREYTQEQFDSVTGLDKNFLEKYCFRFDGKYYLCVDNSRFFNHSQVPNCGSFDFCKDRKSVV